MAVEEEQTEWHLHSGQYLGEISALCFLHLPPQISSLPILLAGSGSEVLAYNLESGNMIESFRVFEGIRVHGISSISLNFSEASSCTKLDFVLVVFGEKRVKLYRVSVEMVAEVCVHLVPLCSLPRFNHWVLDACFLKSRDSSSSAGSDSCGYIAIGCSDNSVHVWDTCESRMILEVESPESCLLYSMRLWGDAIETLRVASGTIFNEIIVWEVVPSEGTLKDCDEKSNDIQFDHLKYEAMHISRLVGHEGSIFRITWSSDGSKLVSVSDDRSARIWRLNAKRSEADKPEDVIVLFGHNARVWDCCIYNSLIITAGEDCTCRAWGLDGKQLEMIKEHIGRGVWRCLYDPMSSLLITAGFDSSIKVHQLNISLSGTSNDPAEITSSSMKRELFTSCIPKSLDHNGLMDSKSEYVRCLRFSSEFTLYVATNHGYLYHATLSDAMDVKWTKVIHINEEVPIVCMDLFPSSPSRVSCEADDWVALGDGQGRMTVLKVLESSNAPKLHLSFNWSAEAERQLLGTFWCKSLGFRYIFTADPRGVLKLWRLNDHVPASQYGENCNVSLIAKYVSCFGLRIMCVDASFEEEIVVCGDVRGNLILFPLSKDLSLDNPITTEVKIIPTCYFKGAHGISTVTSVVIRLDSCQTEIHSTGADGCICHMEYVKLKDQKLLEFIGMKQVRELTSVQSLFYDQNSFLDLTSNLYAIGFASTDFIIWNLITESKVLQIQCGGWRRPYSHYLGYVPELKNCFAYVKDEIIYIHRYWVSDGGKKIFPQNLHVQFHGRELHSVRFIPEGVEPKADNKHDILSRSSWIVTGCEDGTVRLTRYNPSTNNWSASNLLGEHVGGSAVRSICYISEVHMISSDGTIMPDVKDIQESDPDLTENPVLLISAGAKRVLTSWLQKHRKLEKMEGTSACLRQNEEVRNEPSRLASSISFKWLSTDMPTKRSSSHRNSYNIREDAESNLLQEKEELSLKSCPVEKYEDDWRYLAVTGFLVKHFNSRITVCFIVVACSDATLSLRALILPNRLWFDVASLVPVGSPVLTLQHVVVPKFHPNGAGQTLFGNVYIVISGATDGSIAFWDLTGNIEAFMKRLSSLHQAMFIDFQKRPRTGRGSQGGRWRRSLSTVTQGQSSKDLITKKDGDNTILSIQNQVPCKGSSKADISEADTVCSEPVCCASSELVLTSGNSSSKMSEIRPIHVLTNVHQSGVNCLHVAAVNSPECVNNCFLYHVISGGDDQALQCLTFDLSFLSESPISEIMESESGSMKRFILHSEDCNRKYMVRFLRSLKIASAHSSAIKGVWTDGIWVFSTGLDQRIRCWKLEAQGKLVEYTYLIITVPEPEAIDARACDKNHYQIAVAGRGMQVIVFSTSLDTGRR
ncbi:WD repeat-containing protein 6 isoform X2 [Cucurbita maxima]|uniref:WD repeat-containing protein 6 isoform X2 n=1 Tax=Cucurbita maxima TaxID=3661 RepID=A0A6J1K7V5_CUCMA|nr:WD repeat-containing protein 6 isoform X2 [Cucurbita maxima]